MLKGWEGRWCLINALTAEVDLDEGNFTGFPTTYQELTVDGNCPSFCQSVSQTLCGYIDVEIYGYFPPLIACVLANHNVVGMTVLVA
jgi:hypothetical protein